MVTTIERTVIIDAEGTLELRLADLPVGTAAKVIVTVETSDEEEPATLGEMFGKAKGLYSSPEEAVDFIRKERDRWD